MESALNGIEAGHNHDVLSGRGNNINAHPGNKYFRSLVNKLKVEYVATQKSEKGMFAKLIVTQIRGLNPPGRFLKQNPDTGLWDDIGDKKAVDKTRQALREQAPEIEEKIKKGEIRVQSHVMSRLIADQARSAYKEMSAEDSSHGDLSKQNFSEVPAAYDPLRMSLTPTLRSSNASVGSIPGAVTSGGISTVVPAGVPSGIPTGRPHFRDIITGNRISVSDTIYSGNGSAQMGVPSTSRSWMGNSLYVPNGIPNGSMPGVPTGFEDARTSANHGQFGFADLRMSDFSVGMNNSISSGGVDPNRMSGMSVNNNSIQYGQFNNMHANAQNNAYMHQMKAANQMPPPANVSAPPPVTHNLTTTNGMTHRFLEALDSGSETNDDEEDNLMEKVNLSTHDDGPVAIRSHTEEEVGSVPFPGDQEAVGSEAFPGTDSKAQAEVVGTIPFLGGSPEEPGSEPFLGGGSNDQQEEVGSRSVPGGGRGAHNRNAQQSSEAQVTFVDEDMEAIRSSFRTSLNIKDVFEKKPQTRFSMCSRRSSRMSFILRSSFMSSLESDEEERVRQSVHIPDVFKSRQNRRKSVLTESTSQLLETVFGEETASTVKNEHRRESILLRDALKPINDDELMMSLGDFSMSDFGHSEMHMSQFMDQSAQEISNYVDNLAEGERRRMSRQFKMESIMTASERRLSNAPADGMDQSMSDIFSHDDETKDL